MQCTISDVLGFDWYGHVKTYFDLKSIARNWWLVKTSFISIDIFYWNVLFNAERSTFSTLKLSSKARRKKTFSRLYPILRPNISLTLIHDVHLFLNDLNLKLFKCVCGSWLEVNEKMLFFRGEFCPNPPGKVAQRTSRSVPGGEKYIIKHQLRFTLSVGMIRVSYAWIIQETICFISLFLVFTAVTLWHKHHRNSLIQRKLGNCFNQLAK